MTGPEYRRIGHEDAGRPSLFGVLAISVAGVLLTFLALGVIASWEPLNVGGSLIGDVVFGFVAVWVDSRALHAWRRRRDSG